MVLTVDGTVLTLDTRPPRPSDERHGGFSRGRLLTYRTNFRREALGGVGFADPDFSDDEEDGGGAGDGEQGADDPEEGAAQEGGDDGDRAGDVDGSAHDAGGNDVVLDLLVDDAVDEAGNARPEAVGEADQGDDHDADQAADHRDEVGEHHHDRQRHRVLAQADDLQEDEHADAGAERDHELAADVTADPREHLVAEDRDARTTTGRNQAVRRALHRRERREEVQRQDQDREGGEEGVGNDFADAEDAAERTLRQRRVLDVVLRLLDELVALVEVVQRPRLLQQLE